MINHVGIAVFLQDHTTKHGTAADSRQYGTDAPHPSVTRHVIDGWWRGEIIR